MKFRLDLHDIQGNIAFGYGHFSYGFARYVFFKVTHGAQARKFITEIVPLVTTSAPLDRQNGGTQPPATTNLSFTYAGLRELGLPDSSMRSFPADFRMGMKARKDILGDDGPSDPKNWDPVWDDNYSVHIFCSINAKSPDFLEKRYQEILEIVDKTGGVELLKGHRGPDGQDDLDYQAAQAVFIDGLPTSKEHFHYTDGISNPVFKGQTTDPDAVIGAGKPTRKNPATREGWEELETGEFVLGHRDEAKEYPYAPQPRLLSYNGSFMVYRKLHENVGAFNEYLEEASRNFGNPDDPEHVKKEKLKAKFAGRWSNGAPLTLYPTYEDSQRFEAEWFGALNTLFMSPNATDQKKLEARKTYEELKITLRNFNYNDDIDGAKCPVGGHTRRANPRGALEFGKEAFATPGALVDRRRILRRGLPYGDSSDRSSRDGDHGIIFMAINANIERQFEFVQQQWINYGNDFKLSSDKCPILGNHQLDEDGQAKGRMSIDGDKKDGKPPYFCAGMPRFVETRGGDYFFIPSMTALRMIGEGIIDTT